MTQTSRRLPAQALCAFLLISACGGNNAPQTGFAVQDGVMYRRAAYTAPAPDIRYVDFMPGVPLHPDASATEFPSGGGASGNVYAPRASYVIPGGNIASVLRFYRTAMAHAGWERHPQYEMYRRGMMQTALQLQMRGRDTHITYLTGRQLIPDEQWDYAVYLEQRKSTPRAKKEES